MNKLDELLKEALKNQRKIDNTLKSIKESVENLTKEQKDKLGEIKRNMEDELLPEIENLEKSIVVNEELGQTLNFITEPIDFTIYFGKSGNAKILHISYNDLPKIADILNEFLQSKDIKSYVEDASKNESFS